MAGSFWEGRSVGLVLTGGGAKGAYEIGCLKALKRAGITRLTAVSGTSIGGINAFLASRGDVGRAQRIWLQMGRRAPIVVSPPRIALALIERYGLITGLTIQALVLSPPVILTAVLSVGLVLAVGSLLAPARDITRCRNCRSGRACTRSACCFKVAAAWRRWWASDSAVPLGALFGRSAVWLAFTPAGVYAIAAIVATIGMDVLTRQVLHYKAPSVASVVILASLRPMWKLLEEPVRRLWS